MDGQNLMELVEINAPDSMELLDEEALGIAILNSLHDSGNESSSTHAALEFPRGNRARPCRSRRAAASSDHNPRAFVPMAGEIALQAIAN